MPKQPSYGRLPALNALRAFAVAGRHASLRAAAEELFVTPSALSHQIRGLEKQLGVQLFIRSQKGLQLSKHGRLLHPQVDGAFSQMVDALSEISPEEQSDTLTVSMLSTFAMRWFIPRLYRFQQRHPGIEVRISTSIELVDFTRDDIDCAIRSGQGTWLGTQTLNLFEEGFSPVCSPTLPTPDKPLQQPADLIHHTLLHSKMRPHDWREWLMAAGLKSFKPSHEQEFETRNFAIAAAIRGLGVAIIDPLLVQEELKDGRLIQPFDQTLPASRAYYLVWPKNRAETAKLTAFRSWLLEEVDRGA